MKQTLEQHRKLEKDLIKQIKFCNKYKTLIEHTLRDLHQQYTTGRIDAAKYNTHVNKFLQGKQPHHWYNAYDTHIARCNKSLAHTKQKINEITAYFGAKRNVISKALMLFSALFFILGIVMFLNPAMTGFFSYEAASGTIVAQDGATEDGLLWTNIDGAGVYKRCMQLTATSSFDTAQLLAKVTSAIHTNKLTFSLYTNNGINNEPAKQIES